MLPGILSKIEQWLFDPPEAVVGKPLERLLRLLRYPYALFRDLVRGDLTLRAMSLVYTTLLAIVPLLALSFSVLKGLGVHRDLEPVIFEFLRPLGERAGELTSRIMEFVENVRGGVLGSIGLAILLYTVISMIQKVEGSFNFVWRVEQPRSLGRRFSEYLSVMVVGPVLVVAAMGLVATLASHDLVQAISGMEPFGRILVGLGQLMPYLIVAGVFTFMYAFVPNTHVQLRAALTGGLVAGIVWVAGGALFASFVAQSARTIAIYAGFAIVIVALIWLHLSWLILLAGAQLAFYVQHPEHLRSGRGTVRLTPSLGERLALTIMYLVGRGHLSGEHRWSLNALAEYLDLPSTALAPVVAALERQGLLLATETETFVPGRDLDGISLADVLNAVRTDSEHPRLPKLKGIAAAESVARVADEALRSSVAGKTVKDLVTD